MRVLKEKIITITKKLECSIRMNDEWGKKQKEGKKDSGSIRKNRHMTNTHTQCGSELV